MDGGRILRSYLARRFEFNKATKIAKWLTYIIAFIIIIFGFIFRLALVVFALFLYAGAHGKGRFDEAVRLFSIDDTEKKERKREKYQTTHQRLLRKTKNVQQRVEQVLGGSKIGFTTKIIYKFRYYFHVKLTKGRFKPIGEILISFLPLLVRIKDMLKLWLETNQVRKSLIFLSIASVSFSIIWLLPPGLMLLFSTVFLLSFSFSSFIIYYHTRSNRLLVFTVISVLAWLLYMILDLIEPGLHLDYWSYLTLEGVRGCLVPITGILFFASIINNNAFFKRAKASLPISSILIIATLFTLGTLVLFYEIYLLTAYESELSTIKFVLRYDIAYLIWFFASMLISVSLVYLIYLGSIFRIGRVSTVKVITGTVITLFLISFFARDLIIIAIARTDTAPDELELKVGLHGSNITALDFDEFDRLLEVTWSRIYPDEPNSANWSDIDWQLEYAEKNGIDLYFLINPRPPGWFIENHSDSVMRDQWNRTFFWHDQDPRSEFQQSIWDLSFNDNNVTNAKVNFTIEVVNRYANRSCIKYISIQNEPTYPVDFNNIRLASYDPVTEAAFGTWVKNKYDSDLNELKNSTRLEIQNWSELKAPRQSTDRLWEDWRKFREESLTDFVGELTDAVKQNTEKPVTVKIMGHYLARFETFQTGLSTGAVEYFFNLSDVVSLDLYPLTPADLLSALEFYQDLAGDKPIIISEFNLALGPHLPGSGSLLYYDLVLINKFANAVIIFTSDDHYIYGLNLYEHTPVHLGLKLFRLHRAGGDVFSLYGELLYENLLSIPNYYGIYVYACAVWGLPVIPWPILILLLIPIPIANDETRWKVKKINYALVGLLLFVFFIITNFI